MSKPLKQIHLAAHFPGVNNTTVWSDPAAGSHIEFSSFAHFAKTAERAKFDFLFLAEGLRLREQGGKIYDLDVVGRPDTFTILAALAAVTEHLGLTGTINSTFNEPYEVARQFASLDHLSDGRAAWNVVTSWDAFTGENFRRGGFLPQDERYSRAKEFLATTNELFDSWHGDEILADQASGTFLSDAKAGAFVHQGQHFDIQGQFNVPRSPQGRPVIFQAGDSDEGREFAASSADAIFSRYSTLDQGQAFYTDVKSRLAKYGRRSDQLLILPAATFVLGDTDAEAEDLAKEVRRQQVSGATAIKHLEFVWNRDLSSYDPDGPLPDIDPDVSDNHISKGRAQVRMYRDPLATAREWRERAAANNWSIRDLVIETGNRQAFIGSPSTVAKTINDFVQADASDGFILVPHITPTGLDPFADKVVPLLQEQGVFRAEYEGPTLRDHLGLAHPDDVRDETGGVVKFLAITLIVHRPDPVTGVQKSTHERFREVLENAVLAEELGLDGFGVGERHERPFISSSPTVVLSHVAALTRRIRLFTAVTTLSLLDPVRAYEDYATLDHLSGGRLDLIIGKGNGTAQRELFHVTPEDQWERNAESYEVFRQLWRQDKVTAKTRFRPELKDAEVWPRPYQQPIRVWHGSATSKESVDLAARYGDPLFSANVTNPIEPYAELIRYYRERWEHYGHDPADIAVGAGTAGLYVAPTTQEALTVYRPIFESNLAFQKQVGLPIVFETLEDYVGRSSALIGSPQQVIDKVHRYHEQFGHTVLHLHADASGLTDRQHRDSLELFGAAVAPVLRKDIPDPPFDWGPVLPEASTPEEPAHA